VTPSRFRAMGTTIEVHGPPHPSLNDAFLLVAERFHEEERRFSRFRVDSELSAVNRSSGHPVEVSPTFAEVVRLALAGAASSDASFDPTVHDALVAAGYDRTFDEVLAGARGRLHPAVPCGRWREIELEGTRLSLPDGVHLDLGGFVKGWTADVATEQAVRAGLPWVLVNAGGDLRLGGDAPAIDVGVEDPRDPERGLLRLRLSHGALATSSTVARAWGAGEHHVIDPSTGEPARSGVIQATVWADRCADAEILSKRALLRGRSAANDHPSVLVTDDDEVIVSTPMWDAA
jgi:thiamine biosynthesis lipoprotein